MALIVEYLMVIWNVLRKEIACIGMYPQINDRRDDSARARLTRRALNILNSFEEWVIR